MSTVDYCYNITTDLPSTTIDKELVTQHIESLFRNKKKFGDDIAFDKDEKLPIDIGLALVSTNHKQVVLDIKSRAIAIKKRIRKILNGISNDDLIITKKIALKKPEEKADCSLHWFKSGKGEKHWDTLEHNGPYFKHLDPLSKPIERLGVSLYYDGKPYELNEKEEEVATYYARRIITEETGKKKFIQKKEFNDNFFTDFKKFLTKEHFSIFKDFSKLDFSRMVKRIKEIKQAKEEEKRIRREEKKKQQEKRKEEEKAFLKNPANKGKKFSKPDTEKEKQQEMEKKEERIKILEKKLNYSFAFVDGMKKIIRNSGVEMPGIYVGQGEEIGQVKGRIKEYYYPEDIIINVTKGKEAPLPPKGHKWGGIVHDDTARWTAKYRDKITKRLKYILLAETGDLLKFEKARKLNKHIDEIEKRILSLLKSKDSKENQIGCVLYLIKEYGLRVGNEKEDDEDDDDKSEKVVGATTLLVQHVSCKMEDASHNLVLSFKGKDSVSYDGMISVSEAVYKHVEKFLKSKKPNDNLFNEISSNDVNKYLKSIDKDFSAKVFRTRLASSIMYEGLKKLKNKKYDENSDDNDKQKILDFKEVNKEVAVKLNHKKGLTDAVKAKLEKDKQTIDDLKKKIKAEDDTKKKEKLKKELFTKEEKFNEQNEMKEIQLATSLKNYIDPRIVKAWSEHVNLGGCKNEDYDSESEASSDEDDEEEEKVIKHCVDKVYSKALIQHFRWAIEDDTFNDDWDYKETELDCIVGSKLNPEKDSEIKTKEKTKEKSKENAKENTKENTKEKSSVKTSVKEFLLKLDINTEAFKKCIKKISKQFNVQEKTVLNNFYKLRGENQ